MQFTRNSRGQRKQGRGRPIDSTLDRDTEVSNCGSTASKERRPHGLGEYRERGIGFISPTSQVIYSIRNRAKLALSFLSVSFKAIAAS
jgi:hypothetical protein